MLSPAARSLPSSGNPPSAPACASQPLPPLRAHRATTAVAVLPEAIEPLLSGRCIVPPLPSPASIAPPRSIPHPTMPLPRPSPPPPPRRFSRGGRRGPGCEGTLGGAIAHPSIPAQHPIPPGPHPSRHSRRCASRSTPAQASHAIAPPPRPPRSIPPPKHHIPSRTARTHRITCAA